MIFKNLTCAPSTSFSAARVVAAQEVVVAAPMEVVSSFKSREVSQTMNIHF